MERIDLWTRVVLPYFLPSDFTPADQTGEKGVLEWLETRNASLETDLDRQDSGTRGISEYRHQSHETGTEITYALFALRNRFELGPSSNH